MTVGKRFARVGGLAAFAAAVAVPAGVAARADVPTVLPAVQPRIAYATGTQASTIYVASADGSGRLRLGPGYFPVIAPDGIDVAASQATSRGAALVVYPSAGTALGGAAHRFFDVTKVTASALGWSSDSRYLAVQLFPTSDASNRQQGLAVIDTQTWTTRTIVHGVLAGASFAPQLPYQLVFGEYARGGLFGPADIYSIAPDGTARRQLTHDHRSLNPVFGAGRIAFDHEQLRGRDAAPLYQLWTMAPSGGARTQITHMRVPMLAEGLVPLQFSADGERLVAAYEGQDVFGTWTVQLTPRRIRELKVGGRPVQAGGISLDGRQVIVSYGAIESPPSAGTVAALPFAGGRPTVLVRHAAEATWNR